MKDFKRGGGFNRGGDRGGSRFGGGDRGGFGGGNRGGGRGNFNDRPTMHKTNCSECGRVAEVPFKPNGDKPVLCSDCFGGGRNSDRPRINDRGDRGDRRGGDRGFGNKERISQGGGADLGKLKEDVASLHKKMDTIMNLLGAATPISKVKEEEKEPVIKIPKREKPAEGELKKAVKKAVKTAKKEIKKVTKKVAKKVSKKKK